MLSLQEGVIDATNEEGQRRLKEIEEEERQRKRVEMKADGEGAGSAGVAGGGEDGGKSGGSVVPEKVTNIVDEID